MSKNKHTTMVAESEMLSVTVGSVKNKPVVIFSIRIDPDNDFEVSNLAFTPKQAIRMMRDLKFLLTNSEELKKAKKSKNFKSDFFKVMEY